MDQLSSSGLSRQECTVHIGCKWSQTESNDNVYGNFSAVIWRPILPYMRRLYRLNAANSVSCVHPGHVIAVLYSALYEDLYVRVLSARAQYEQKSDHVFGRTVGYRALPVLIRHYRTTLLCPVMSNSHATYETVEVRRIASSVWLLSMDPTKLSSNILNMFIFQIFRRQRS